MSEEIIGKTFGFWTVIKKSENKNKKDKHKVYLCRCICGKEHIIRKSSLVNSKSMSCGCGGNIYYKGKKYGRLLCISDLFYTEDKNGNKRKTVKVQCDCGTIKDVLIQSLENGFTTSCGCYNKEVLSTRCKENHPRYNPNLTDDDRKANDSRMTNKGYQAFRRKVLKKYNNTCQSCGMIKEKDMRVHHLYSWNIDKDNRLNIDNAIVLCPQCHDIQYEGSFHNIYGNGNNTPEQVYEFINTRKKEAV